MDVLIRSIDKDVLYKIDQKAKNRNCSRNQYINEILKMAAQSDDLMQKDLLYKNLVEKVALVIEKNTETINHLIANEPRKEREEWKK